MIAPYQAFPTADGYAMIAAGSDALFRRLAHALADPDLGADPRFADNPSRVRNRAALVDALTALTRRLKTADLLERLAAAGRPSAPVPTLDRRPEVPRTGASPIPGAAAPPRV